VVALDIIVIFDDDDVNMAYPGGKGKCFQRLINLMPPHSTYIESHLGGGAVLRHKRAALVNIGIDLDSAVIQRWHREHPGLCTLIHADAASFLAGYPFTGSELIYADPPYVPELRRRCRVYRHDYGVEEHHQLLEVLMNANCMVLVSGYDSTLYNQLLKRWRKVKFFAKTHVDVREECVWMNFEPHEHLHDGSFMGDTFRDRQTVRRRHSRVLSKFRRMQTSERDHLLGLLNAEHLAEGSPQ
jgi:DNA adenine methylase